MDNSKLADTFYTYEHSNKRHSATAPPSTFIQNSTLRTNNERIVITSLLLDIQLRFTLSICLLDHYNSCPRVATMMKLLYCAVCLTAVFKNNVQASQFKWQHDMVCDYPVTANIESMTCDGQESCYLGEEMDVYGSITLSESLPTSTLCVTIKSCFLGIKLSPFCQIHQENVDLCTALGMSGGNSGGTACPNKGSFYFDYTFELPTEGGWMFSESGSSRHHPLPYLVLEKSIFK